MELKIINNGEWNSELITRRETVAEAFARELAEGKQKLPELPTEEECEENMYGELPGEIVNELTERD